MQSDFAVIYFDGARLTLRTGKGKSLPSNIHHLIIPS